MSAMVPRPSNDDPRRQDRAALDAIVQQGAERATALGGQVLLPPMEVPGGDWIVVLRDPQGAVFALHHLKKG